MCDESDRRVGELEQEAQEIWDWVTEREAEQRKQIGKLWRKVTVLEALQQAEGKRDSSLGLQSDGRVKLREVMPRVHEALEMLEPESRSLRPSEFEDGPKGPVRDRQDCCPHETERVQE